MTDPEYSAGGRADLADGATGSQGSNYLGVVAVAVARLGVVQRTPYPSHDP